MTIRFSVQSGDFELAEPEKVKNWIVEVVRRRGMTVGNIGYLFCDDEYLLGVNRQYLDHDTYTDIITFDYVAGGLVSGDILISVERVGENAQKFGVTFDEELLRVIVHGTLHLCGYKDKSDEEAAIMRRKEQESIALFHNKFFAK